MIKIEINSNIDESLNGQYNFLFDEIFIGRSLKSDIIINDSEIPSNYLKIQFLQNKLIIINEKNSPFYFVNGKKMSGLRRLLNNDIIEFGKHKIKILSAEKNISDRDEEHAELVKAFLNKHPEANFILDFLEEEIIRLESNKNGDKVV